MNGKDFVIDDRCNRKKVKNICKILPDYCISILCLTFHVKSVILGNCSGLMIPSYHVHLVWIFYFKEAQQGNDFDRMGPSIDKITQKKVTCVRKLSSDFEDL